MTIGKAAKSFWGLILTAIALFHSARDKSSDATQGSNALSIVPPRAEVVARPVDDAPHSDSAEGLIQKAKIFMVKIATASFEIRPRGPKAG
jgi:hypothetical protein